MQFSESMLRSVDEGTTFSSDEISGGNDGAGSCGGIPFTSMIGEKVKSSLNPRMVSLGLTVVIVCSSGKP
jgi:hypothetical protein